MFCMPVVISSHVHGIPFFSLLVYLGGCFVEGTGSEYKSLQNRYLLSIHRKFHSFLPSYFINEHIDILEELKD